MIFTTRMRDTATYIGRNHRFPRKLPADLGGAFFWGSTEGGLKYLRRNTDAIDPDLTAAARTCIRPGNNVWDIGANLGLFTFAAAGLAGTSGKVLALEPDTWLAQGLRSAARRNRGRTATVDVLPMAVNDHASVARFLIAAQSRASNSLAGHGNYHMDRKGARETQLVPTTTLDLLLREFPAPDVVKIDVEHAEIAALRGARQLLAEHRPVLIIEVAPPNQNDATALLVDAGYRLIDGQTGEPSAHAVWSTIALPQ